MQGRRSDYSKLSEPLLFLREVTDTATPRTPIPIYFIHELNAPFCSNQTCQCQRSRIAINWLYLGIESRELTLAQVERSITTELEEDNNIPPTYFYPKYGGVCSDELPALCAMYGHDFEETNEAGVKACRLCFTRGFCPGCTPISPHSAQPFLCTTHTPKSEVQQ